MRLYFVIPKFSYFCGVEKHINHKLKENVWKLKNHRKQILKVVRP